jgi:hypothetical protein
VARPVRYGMARLRTLARKRRKVPSAVQRAWNGDVDENSALVRWAGRDPKKLKLIAERRKRFESESRRYERSLKKAYYG